MMNPLSPPPNIQDESLTKRVGSQETYELKVFNENEAYRQLEIILLILYLEKNGTKPIYLPHQKKQNTYTIVDKNIHESLRRIDPHYLEDKTCTSPEVDLFRKVLKENITLHHLTVSQSDFWIRSHNDAIALAPNQFILKAEILNEFCYQISCSIASDTSYQKASQLRQEKSINQNKKIKRLVRKLFNTFRKLLVIKMDFFIHPDHTVPLELLKIYLRAFIKKLHAPNDKVPPIVGFVWKLEYSDLKRYHYHFLFFMDANEFTENHNFADKLGELWQSITLKKGVYQNFKHDKPVGKNLAIGVITHDDQEKIDALHLMIDHITKTEQFIIEKGQTNQRTFGYSTRKYATR
nr:inovirus-type Gp2 protein [Acinetobacter baumannii]